MTDYFGVMGLIGSGKDTVADYLRDEHGFYKATFKDVVVHEAEKRGLEPTRDNLQDVQRTAREENGDDYFARRVADEMEEHERAVAAGLRNPVDPLTLKDRLDDRVTLLLVEADADKRYARMKSRGRPDDPETRQEFERQEARDKNMFDFEKTFSHADEIVDNNGTLAELQEQVDNLVRF